MAEHTGPNPTQQTTTSRPDSRFWWLDPVLFLTVPTILAIDYVTKKIVRDNMVLGQSIPEEGLIRITYGLNTGTAFGLLPNQTLLLIIASIVAIGFLIYFYRSHALPRPILRIAIGLQLGGAFGNLLDRVVRGAVVDFIDIGWWPIFNIADSSIVTGMAVLIGVLLLGDMKAAREKNEPNESSTQKGDD